jgi:AcrR family transcriptional regulator
VSGKLLDVTPATRAPRSDARRNRDALVAAGRAIFARLGTDAPMEEVARTAGVGRGTLYRHFPTREHLFAAILQERTEELRARADELLAAEDIGAALDEWLRLYHRNAVEYRGMHVGLADEASPVARACGPMNERFAELYGRARQEGAVRSELEPAQVLALVSALPADPRTGESSCAYLDVVLAGLRASRQPH